MADTMRPMSFLPTVKCSDCGDDIEISHMADHVCSTAPAAPTQEVSAPAPAPANNRQKYGASLSPASSGYSKPGRPDPLSIDPGSANKPFAATRNLPTPDSSYSSRRTPSPANTSSRLSPDPSAQSYSYSYTKHSDPYGMSYGSQNDPPARRFDSAMGSPESESIYGPRSPRSGGGDNVLQRMNTIQPGPFSSRNSRQQTDEASGGPEPDDHRRMASMNSARQNSHVDDSGRAGISHRPQPSASSVSDYSRSSAYSNRSIGLPSNPSVGRAAARSMRSDRGEDDGYGGYGMQRRDRSRSRDPSVGGRSNMGYMARRGLSTDKTLPRRPTQEMDEDDREFEPRAFGRSATDPVRDTGDNPFTRGRRNMSQASNGYSSRSASHSRGPSRGRMDPRVNDAPPVPPAPPKAQNPFVGSRSHAPSDSESSAGSGLSSGAKTGSSRSSPPGSEDLGYPSQKPGGSLRGPRGAGPGPQGQLPSGPASGFNNSGLPSMRRPNVPEPLPTDRFNRPLDGPESPMDPAIQAGMFTSPPPREKPARQAPPARPPRETPRPVAREDPPAALPRAGTRKASGQSKGICRGCGEDIFGKSVKAADGRLTGRYHKECFVCKTCKRPFETADFYVYNNSPYCEHHYHQLNGSLCTSCSRGIEGQYLETDHRQKFHPRCFTCVTCRRMMRDDYFELNGRVYCERHAFTAAQQNRFAGGPRRNPERRKTRLMMM